MHSHLILLLCVYGVSGDLYYQNKTFWGYYKHDAMEIIPKHWKEINPKCEGVRQSPINIVFSHTEFDSQLHEIQIEKAHDGDESMGEAWTLVNNGHSALLTSNKVILFSICY